MLFAWKISVSLHQFILYGPQKVVLRGLRLYHLNISLNDKILFIESLLIPAFNPKNKLDTSEKREEWLQTRGVQKKWQQEILTELIERYGMVNSLEEAKRLLEKEEKRKLGKSSIICSPFIVFTLFYYISPVIRLIIS